MIEQLTPQPQPCDTLTERRRLTIGLPACRDASERRFPLTPEAAGRLVEAGFEVKVENGAGAPINYTDEQYAAAGVTVTSRADALTADVVVSVAALSAADAARLRRNSVLLTLTAPTLRSPETAAELLKRKILTLALDLLRDREGNTPIADILAEIDGRASVALAASLLADPRRGKGILLGGVAGVIPCEVTIIGSGIAAVAAARSAAGLGAVVRMFDDDIYSLRRAAMQLGQGVITSVLHPKVLSGAFRSADVVVVTADNFKAGSSLSAVMKRGVVVMDLTHGHGRAFPAMRAIDLATVSASDPSATLPGRLCLTNAGSAVARTAAMALSNSLITLLQRIGSCDCSASMLRIGPEIRCAALTFMGHPVNRMMAEAVGTGPVDISIFLTLS